MISHKEAILKAREFLTEILAEGNQMPRGREWLPIVEEIVLTDDNPPTWIITFSYVVTVLDRGGIEERVYKTVHINAETGEPKAIKMRVLD